MANTGANIKYRLRRRGNNFDKKVDIIDITGDAAEATPNNIEVIDLTDDRMLATLSPGRLTDFRHRIRAVFRKDKRQSMTLFRLARRINLGNAERFSKMEIDSALLQMDAANEISLWNGVVCWIRVDLLI